MQLFFIPEECSELTDSHRERTPDAGDSGYDFCDSARDIGDFVMPSSAFDSTVCDLTCKEEYI